MTDDNKNLDNLAFKKNGKYYNFNVRVAIEYQIKSGNSYKYETLNGNILFGYPLGNINTSLYLLMNANYCQEISPKDLSESLQNTLFENDQVGKIPLLSISMLTKELETNTLLNDNDTKNVILILRKLVIIAEYLFHNSLPEYDLDETVRLILIFTPYVEENVIEAGEY